jgi:hypothetical protein
MTIAFWLWALASGSAAVAQPPATRQAVVWLLTDSGDGAIARGAAMGAEEMTRTTTLLGARFVLHRVAATSANVPLDVRTPAFVVLDVDSSQACAVSKRFAGQPGVVVMNARVDSGGCETPPLLLRLPRKRRDTLLSEAGSPGGRVEEWHPSLQRFGAQELNARYERWAHAPMSADAWAGWFATKIAAEATLRLPRITRQALVGPDALAFDGHKGAPLRFDASGVLQQPVYLIGASGTIIKEIE